MYFIIKGDIRFRQYSQLYVTYCKTTGYNRDIIGNSVFYIRVLTLRSQINMGMMNTHKIHNYYRYLKMTMRLSCEELGVHNVRTLQ